MRERQREGVAQASADGSSVRGAHANVPLQDDAIGQSAIAEEVIAMVAFFIPGHTPEQAERLYSDLPKSTYSPAHPSARLYSIHFRQDGYDCTATVGEEISGWPDQHGVVMAIIETERLIFVHTLRSLNSGDVIHVDPIKTTDRKYFDDYPGDDYPGPEIVSVSSPIIETEHLLDRVRDQLLCAVAILGRHLRGKP